MSILDFIAFFIYTFIFSFIFSLSRKKIRSASLRRHHRNAFWLKVISSFAFAIFVLYISKGDTTTLYYPEGYNLYKKVLTDSGNLPLLFGSGTDVDSNLLANPNQYGYFRDDSNFMVIRLTAIFCFLTFGKYMVVNLIFAMIAFSGIWKLFRFFVTQYPELEKQFAIAILYLPTFTFWSSGIMKDPISISCLGWFTYAIYELAVLKKGLIKNVLIILLTVYVFSIIKIYILVAYLPALVIFLLLVNAQLVKNTLGRVILVGGFLIGSIIGFSFISTSMQSAVVDYAGEDITEGIIVYQKNYSRQQEKMEGSYFSLGVEFDGSIGSLAKVAPAAIIATFFRPFLWESRNVSTLLSSFESLALLLFTLYVLRKVGLKQFIFTIFKKPIVLYCFMFSMIFALFVGATTLNFGTLVRYKIPCMPFYVISLFFILYFDRKRKTEMTATTVPVETLAVV